MISLLAVACSPDDAPPLEVSELTVFAPLPGSAMSVAYLRLSNNTTAEIVIDEVGSPEFARAELHESSLDDGVARMREISTLAVPAGQSVRLEEGGLHIMLMQPTRPLSLGDPVSLRLGFDGGGEIRLKATLRSRVTLETD